MPPTGNTFPVSDTSPVMDRSSGILLPVARLSRAVTMVQPALGPSFGVAPFKGQGHSQSKVAFTRPRAVFISIMQKSKMIRA